MKRVLCFVLVLAMVFALTACGGSKPTPPETTSGADKESSGSGDTDELLNIGGVKVEEGLDDVTLTIPAEFIGEVTQEELDASAAEKGYKSATLNDDGSVTFVMTKAQHEEMLSEVSDSIDEGLEELAQSEEFPNFVSIDANDDYTDFKVVTSSEELGLMEGFSTFFFYTYGGMYSAFAGKKAENIHVSYINESTGEVIEEVNSSDMG